MLSRKKEIFKNICNEKLDRVEELTKNINYDNLNSLVQSSGNETNFIEVEDPMVFLNDIKRGKWELEKTKNLQEGFRKLLKNISKGNKSERQKKTLANINRLSNL